MPSAFPRGRSAPPFCSFPACSSGSRSSCCCLHSFHGLPAASIRGVVTDTSGAKVTGATVALLSNGKVVGLRRLRGRRQLPDPHRHSPAASSSSSPPRAFASWRRPASTPAGSTRSSATWCSSPSGCASPSWSPPPARPRRSRRPAPQPTCSGRSILPRATIWSASLRLMPGTVVGADRPAWRANLAVHSRRRLRRQQNPPRRRRAPATWAADSILARSRPPPSKAPRSIAAPIRTSTAPMRPAASSA